MTKKYMLIFFLIGALLTSCNLAPTEAEKSRTTGTVKLVIDGAETPKSILPSSPEVKGYTITLTNQGSAGTTYTNNFKKGETIVFESVLIGNYNINVNAYSDEDYENLVAQGTATMTVTPTDDNSVTVDLNWIDGYGSFGVTIDWENLTNKDNFIYKAIENESLGFLAWDVENKQAFNDAEIQWVTDYSKNDYIYRQSNVPTEKDHRSTQILFRVYSKIDGKNQVIAETFNTYVTIFANIESVPDGNESFSINNDNIVYYLKNVTDVTASLNEEDSAKNIDIAWKYPYLSDGNYLLSVWITNNSDKQTVQSKTFEYSIKDNVVTGETSTTFSGLDPKYLYTVHFGNRTNDENLVYSYSAEITPICNIRTQVKVESISFENSFDLTYVMGASANVGAVIAPTDATYQDYTVTASEGVVVSDKSVSFPTSGDYKITLTSEDKYAVSGSVAKTVTVRLAAPTALSAERTNDGVELSWTAVESATGYTIEKKYAESTETLRTSGTSYVDTNVSSGVTYSYSVKATREDSKFDSNYCEEVTAKLPNKVINITLPEDVERESFATLVESAINNQYVTDTQGITINLDASSDFFDNASYKWSLNGITLNGTNSLSIDSSTKGLNINSYESTNTLMLSVTKGDYTYSASSTFHYITAEPGEVTITGSDTVTYGEPIQLTATTEVGSPIIVWSSSDTNVATVDSTGVVTALIDGNTTITATVVATGKSTTKVIKTYIPAGSISFNAIPHWLIIEKDGVSVSDSYKSVNLNDYIVITGVNGKKATSNELSWSDSNNNNSISVSNGSVSTVSKGNAGTPRVTATRDGVSGYIDIPVYTFDVYYKGSAITGTSKSLSAVGTENYTLEIKINNGNSSLSNLSYSWSRNKTSGASAICEINADSSDSSKATLHLVSNYATYEIKASLSNGNDKDIACIWFNRTK